MVAQDVIDRVHKHVKDTVSWGHGKFSKLSRGAFNMTDIPGDGNPLEAWLDMVSDMTPSKLIDNIFKGSTVDLGNWKYTVLLASAMFFL